MTYADTDFFLALMKESDWLKRRAAELHEKYRGQLWTSPATMIELLLLCAQFGLNPETVVRDAMMIAELRGAEANVFLAAAHYMKEKKIGVFDAVHAGFCGKDSILSSDKVFDRLGLKRIPLGADRS